MTESRNLEQENQELSSSLLNAYEIIESLGPISDCFEVVKDSLPLDRILDMTDHQLRKLFPFHTTAFFLFPSESEELECHNCHPHDARNRVEKLILEETDSGNIHIALRDQSPMLRHIPGDENERLLIHSMGTSRRSRGIFAGIYQAGSRHSDRLSQLLLTLVLSQTSNALDSADLFYEMQRFSRLLTGTKEQHRISFEKLNKGVDRMFSLFQRLSSAEIQSSSEENNARLSVMRWTYHKFTSGGTPENQEAEHFLADLTENYESTFGYRRDSVRLYGSNEKRILSLETAVPLAIGLFELLSIIFHRSSTPPENPIDLSITEVNSAWEVRVREDQLHELPSPETTDMELFKHLILNELGGTLLTPGDGSQRITGFKVQT